MLTKEIIQRIQSLYSKGVQSDDSRLTSRHIYSKMLTLRAKLLSQKINKKQFISQWNFQTIPCIQLVKAPTHECPCLPPVGCQILKTKVPLPQTINGLNGHVIQSVTSIEGDVVYSEVSWLEKKYKASAKYTAKKPDFYIRNNYLYITHVGGSKLISITGLFENPSEVDQYPSYCDNCVDCVDCESPLDKEFPLESELVDTLVEMSVNELIVAFSQGREDATNNTRDNIQQETK